MPDRPIQQAFDAYEQYIKRLESEVERLREEVRFMHAARQWDGTPGEAAKKLERVRDKEFIRGAVARGWGVEPNTHKELDVDLADAIAEQVADAILDEDSDVGK